MSLPNDIRPKDADPITSDAPISFDDVIIWDGANGVRSMTLQQLIDMLVNGVNGPSGMTTFEPSGSGQMSAKVVFEGAIEGEAVFDGSAPVSANLSLANP